jgi:osmotically-inducible protein OsmY
VAFDRATRAQRLKTATLRDGIALAGRESTHMERWNFRRYEEEESSTASILLAFLGGVGLGVGAMYLFDPDRGAQRRSWMRDKAVRWRHQIADTADATSRDVAQRARGVVARTRTWFRHEDDVPDDTLVERVRAEMGRKVSHPRSIVVEAHAGTVMLAGPIFAEEVDRLIRCVEKVRGVRSVENLLEVHATAENVPGLQGAEPITGGANFWQRTWPPATRLWTGAGGFSLVLLGLTRRSPVGYVASVAGTALFVRALTNSPTLISMHRGGGQQGEGDENGDQQQGSDGASDENERFSSAGGQRSTGSMSELSS